MNEFDQKSGTLLFRIHRGQGGNYIISADATEKSNAVSYELSEKTTVKELLMVALDKDFARVFSSVIFQFLRETTSPIKAKKIAREVLKGPVIKAPVIRVKAFPEDEERFQFHYDHNEDENPMGWNIDVNNFDLFFFTNFLFALVKPEIHVAQLEVYQSQTEAKYESDDTEPIAS